MFGIKVRSPFKKSKSTKAGTEDGKEKATASDADVNVAQSNDREASAALPPVATAPSAGGPPKEGGKAVSMANKQLEIRSEEFTLPKDVSSWKSDDVLYWLRTVFDGSDNLPGYEQTFSKIGVRGVDLLSIVLDMKVFRHLGIVDQIHSQRFKSAVEAIRKKQSDLDANHGYDQLREECDALRKKNPDYSLPRKVESWKPLDVVFFMTKPEYAHSLDKLLRPIANERLNGKKIVEMCNSVTPTTLNGVPIDDDLRARLKDALKSYTGSKEEHFAATLRVRKNMVRAAVPTVQGKFTLLSQMNSGSFGIACLGLFNSRKVVRKELKNGTPVPASKPSGPSSAPDSDDANEDIWYEAYMLVRAAGPGVLRLVTVTEEVGQKPGLIAEYLCHGSLLNEYRMAAKNSEDSIFHPNHDHNKYQMEQKISDPVLLQKVRIARDVALALAHVHSKGIIHLDIAGRNIFLDGGKRPKIGDFGHAAFEREMLDQHEVVAEHLKAELFGGQKTRQELLAALNIGAVLKEESGLDPNAMRKFDLHVKFRPLRSMPDWVADANPLLDFTADVYSFGCVMYEMATFQMPHEGVSDQDVLFMKQSQRDKIILPAGLDREYARIMSSCWVAHDCMPRMETVAQQLVELHQRLLKSAFPEDACLREVKQMSALAGAANRASLATYTSVVGVLSKQKTVSAAATKVYPKIAGGRIRLNFPAEAASQNESAFYEYRDAGISKEKLISALRSAFRLKDAKLIADTVSVIKLDIAEEQMEVVILCLGFLEKLAQDDHSETDVHDLELCAQVTAIAQSAEQSVSLCDNEKDRLLVVKLLTAALAAAASLLGQAQFSVDHRAETSVVGASLGDLLLPLVKTTLSVMRHFNADPRLIEKAAELISAVAEQPQLPELEGIVRSCLEACTTHVGDMGVARAIARAPRKFTLAQLCDVKSPQHASAVKSPLSGVCADATADLAGQLGEAFACLLNAAAHWLHKDGGEDVVTSTLSALFDICNKSAPEQWHIERFFFCLRERDVDLLFAALREFPDNFRVQESVAGLLAYAVESGVGIMLEPVGKSRSEGKTHAPAVTPSRQRLLAVLRCDPQFTSLLSSMDRFTVNDRDLLTSKRQLTNRTHENAISRGAHSAFALSATHSQSSASRKYGFSNNASTVNIANLQQDARTPKELYEIIMVEGVRDGYDEELIVDVDGEQLSAASLQKSVMVLIGAACNHVKKLQLVICETNFSNLVILAFQNFPRDVQLIRLGCHALFSVCRGESKPQKILHQLHTLNRVCETLSSLKSFWQVSDGVICVLLGLLEPSEKRKALTSSEQKMTECYGVAHAATLDQSKNSLISWLISSVADFQVDAECHPLVGNFLRLLSSLIYWKPQLLEDWCKTFIVFSENQKKMHAYLFGRAIGRLIKVNHQASGARSVTAKTSAGKSTTGKTSAGKTGSDLKDPADPPVKEEGIKKDTKEAEAHGAAVGEHSLGLEAFLSMSIKLHQGSCHVVGAGLALLTSTFLRCLKAPVPLGKPLPYDINTSLTAQRRMFLDLGLFEVLIASFGDPKSNPPTPTEHPVRIRYTLWLFILLISEQRHARNALVLEEGNGSSLTAEICAKRGIPWAISVIRLHQTNYSLQCLSAIFLIKMESYGHFETCKDLLPRLASLLLEVRAQPPTAFMTPDEEDYDTNLLGAAREETFGKLQDHFDQLTLLIEDRLQPGIAHNDLSTWDGRICPFSLRVVGWESEEDPATLHMYTTYVLEVRWDDEVRWSVSKRFSFYMELQNKLVAEFSTLNCLQQSLVKPGKTILTTRSLDSRQDCTNKLDAWIQQLQASRAVLFSSNLLDFIEARTHVPDQRLRLPKWLSADQVPLQQAHMVTCTAVDVVNQVYFVGCGVLQGALGKLFGKADTMRGTVSAYNCAAEAATSGQAPRAVLRFSAGVMSLAWDSRTHCLFVGLATGSIVYYSYQLTPDAAPGFSYVTEINFHSHPVLGLRIDPVSRVLYSASPGGSLLAYNVSEGTIVSQGTCVKGTVITAVVVIVEQNWLVCGTEQGSLLVYDLSRTSALLAHDRPHQLPPSARSSAVTALCFIEETQIVCAAVENVLHLLRLPFTAVALQSSDWKWCEPLALQSSVQISQLLAIERGKYIVATCGNEGSVVIFDVSERKPDRTDSTHADRRGHDEDLATSAAAQVPWEQAVHLANAEMRTWFQGAGVGATDALTRASLLKLMQDTQHVSRGDIVNALRPKKPVRDAFIVLTLREPKDNRTFVTHVQYFEPRRAILFGCVDGTVMVLSLEDFLDPETASDKRDLQRLLAQSTAQFQENPLSLKGSKASNGKRLQLA